jgi:membrane-associated protease RseP (regulator of RpoE activity)
MGLFGWVIFLFALCATITVHEFGHFVTAKKFGMKVTRFFVGMGPTVWSIRRGETEYGVKALPVGGFNKIVGMHSLDDPDDPADEPRAFRRQSAWQRIVVLLAGIVVNLVIGVVLVAVLVMTIGRANDNTTQLGTVAPCVAPNVTDLNNQTCGSSKQPSPAKLAGLRVGDVITSFNGKPVSTYDELTSAIQHAKPGSMVSITVRRDGRTLTLRAKPAQIHGRAGAYLGIIGTRVFQTTGPLGAVKYAGSFFGQTMSGLGGVFGHLPSAASKLFSKNRSSNANGQLCSLICAGQQTSQAVATSVGWRSTVEAVVIIAAELNLIVGVFNVLPLMPLDGGLAAVIGWESFRSWLARLRGRPDPGMVDIRKVLPVMASVFLIVMLFAVVVMIADVVNPVHLGQ